MLGSKNGRVFQEEANVFDLVFGSREESGEGIFVVREILMTWSLVVIQLTNLAELKFKLLPFLLFLCIVVILVRQVRFRVRV